jgi:hypothetical protein
MPKYLSVEISMLDSTNAVQHKIAKSQVKSSLLADRDLISEIWVGNLKAHI